MPTPTQLPLLQIPALQKLEPQQSPDELQCPPSLTQPPLVHTPPVQTAVPQHCPELAQWEPEGMHPPPLQTFWALQVKIPQQSPVLLQWPPSFVQDPEMSGTGVGSGSSGMSQAVPKQRRSARTGARRRNSGSMEIVYHEVPRRKSFAPAPAVV